MPLPGYFFHQTSSFVTEHQEVPKLELEEILDITIAMSLPKPQNQQMVD